MSVLAAIANILGASIAFIAFGVGVLMFNVWWDERYKKAALDEMSIALGIPVEDLNRTENEIKVLQFAALRFSSDRFSNRFSDLCGWVQTCWGWLGYILQVGFLLVVIWNTATDDRLHSLYAWWVIAVAFFFWVTAVFFALACKLVTGRYPGQPRQARKMLAQIIQQRRYPSDHEMHESY